MNYIGLLKKQFGDYLLLFLKNVHSFITLPEILPQDEFLRDVITLSMIG